MTRMLKVAAATILCWAGQTLASPGPHRLSDMPPQDISCGDTPFGRRLAVGREQEVAVLARTNYLGTNYNVAYMLETGAQLSQVDPFFDWGFSFNPSAPIANATQPVSARIDIDGDGKDELAVAGATGNTIAVALFKHRSDGNALVEYGDYRYDNPSGLTVQTVQIASARIADRSGHATDSREQLILAIQYSNKTVKVVALSGNASGFDQASNAALTTWNLPTTDTNLDARSLRMAAGDVLLEGRDQVVVSGTTLGGQNRAYYVLRHADNASTFTANRFEEERTSGTGTVLRSSLHIADFGGSAAAELLVADQNDDPDAPGLGLQLKLGVRWFATTRDPGNAITGITMGSPSNPTYTVPQGSGRIWAVATGEVNRSPGAEIVVARQNNPNDVSSANNDIFVEVYKVGFDTTNQPRPVVIKPLQWYAGGQYHNVSVERTVFRNNTNQLSVAIGDSDKTGIGDVWVAVADYASNSSNTPVVNMGVFRMARPADPNAFPDPSTFANTFWATGDISNTVTNTSVLQVQPMDWDGNSVLADIGTQCQRVQEPMVRSIVRMPAYWDLFSSGGYFNATIGKSSSQGTNDEHNYGTFTSHDISGYVGVSVGGDFMGIGAKITAKATAGYSYESSRGESFSTENTLETQESQSQSMGEGLVVFEQNTFDCYTYDVVSGGVQDAGSSLRSCELLSTNTTGDNPRSYIASDLLDWDNSLAQDDGLGPPAQWTPLYPDWASLALFHPATTNFTPSAGAAANVTDGKFGTALASPSMATPYVQIDLGAPQDISNIRVFGTGGNTRGIDGFNLYASLAPFAGNAPPSGAGVTRFTPDPASRNGFDRWNVWARNLASGAPLRARYLRLQHPGTAALQVSEIQVFGDVHIEPPAYPESVCDPTYGDGIFTARVWNAQAVPPGYQNVDVHGELLWSGAPTDADCGSDYDLSGSGGPKVGHGAIWDGVKIGASGDSGNHDWSLAQSSTIEQGTTTSISHSTSVGAELDVEGGFVVEAQLGGSYQFSTGVTEDESSSMFWSTSLTYGGGIGSFPQNVVPNQSNCAYRPQPYAYTSSARSNIGYEHQFTVVDYVVRDGFGWNRSTGGAPSYCYKTPPDILFADGFEQP